MVPEAGREGFLVNFLLDPNHSWHCQLNQVGQLDLKPANQINNATCLLKGIVLIYLPFTLDMSEVVVPEIRYALENMLKVL